MSKQMTLAESMALAVLKGDISAAYSLAEDLLRQRDRGDTPLDQGYREMVLEGAPTPPLGFDVYHWPEFVAFARRLGLLWELGTYDTTITIPAEGTVKIEQSYRGNDTTLRPLIVDTTTQQNAKWRTARPGLEQESHDS
jgi:hypothetical protein